MVPTASVVPALRPILYSFRRCPYAMRARLALLASGQTHGQTSGQTGDQTAGLVGDPSYEHREILLRDKPLAMLAASPKGTVPVLVLPSGLVLHESLDIMLWALQQHDPLHWLAPSRGTLADAMALIAQCDGPFKLQLDAYKYPQRQGMTQGATKPLDKSSATNFTTNTDGSVSQSEVATATATARARDQAAPFLLQLNQQLGTQPALFGASFGFADAAIAPFVRQFAAVQPDWFASQPWPALQHWLADFCESALFAASMQKQPIWRQN